MPYEFIKKLSDEQLITLYEVNQGKQQSEAKEIYNKFRDKENVSFAVFLVYATYEMAERWYAEKKNYISTMVSKEREIEIKYQQKEEIIKCMICGEKNAKNYGKDYGTLCTDCFLDEHADYSKMFPNNEDRQGIE